MDEREIVQKLIHGFNVSVVVHGYKNTGKTNFMFHNDTGLYYRILDLVLKEDVAVGLKCWEILNNQVEDLMHSTKDSIVLESMQDGEMAMSRCRRNSVNFSCGESVSNQAHFMVRLQVYSKQNQCLGTLHLLDLIGKSKDLNLDQQDIKGWENQLLLLGQENAMNEASSLLVEKTIPVLTKNVDTIFVACVNEDIVDETLDTLTFHKKCTEVVAKVERSRNVVLSFTMDWEKLEEEVVSTEHWLEDFAERRRKMVVGNEDVKALFGDAEDIHEKVVVNEMLEHKKDLQDGLFNQESFQNEVPKQPDDLKSKDKVEKQQDLLKSMEEYQKQELPMPVEELLLHANVPFMPPPIPETNALDDRTAHAIQVEDSKMMRINYDGLLHVIREQHVRYSALQQKYQALQYNVDEKLTAQAIQMDTLKVESIRQKGIIRQLENMSNYANLFLEFEEEIDRLSRANRMLRQENTTLILQSNGSPSHDLRQRVKELSNQTEKLREQVRAHSTLKRKLMLNQKHCGRSARHVSDLTEQLQQRESTLLQDRLSKAKLGSDVQQLRIDNNTLREKLSELHKIHDNTSEELVSIKLYLSTIEKETKKSKLLSQFVQKHAQPHSTNQTPIPIIQNPLNDQTFDNLLLQSKPLFTPDHISQFTSIQHHIQQQRLLISEYTTRESSYIHLLDQLANDQPQYSLKDKIHSEIAQLL